LRATAREPDPVVERRLVTNSGRGSKTRQGSLLERRVARIANARSVTLGLAATTLGLALVAALVMRITDKGDFPSFGLAVWWALQTVTTVGYGDVVPTTGLGRVVGGLTMVIGASFIAFLTAGVTSTVIQRGQAAAQEVERAQSERDLQTVVGALTETRDAIAALDKRLENIESRLSRADR
jgi:voltage-gated potassium channel